MSQKDELSPIEGEVDELKQDISSFRFEVLNKLTTQAEAIEENMKVLSAKLDMITYKQHGVPVQYSGHQYSPSDVTPITSKVAEWRCDDVITPELNINIASRHAPSETDSVINGDHGNLADFETSDNSVQEEEIVPQRIQRTLSERKSKSKESLSEPAKEQFRLLKKRPHGRTPTDEDGGQPSTSHDGGRQHFKPRYLRSMAKEDLDKFINLLESSC